MGQGQAFYYNIILANIRMSPDTALGESHLGGDGLWRGFGGGGGGICKGNRGRELEGCDLPAREFRLFRGPFVPNFDSDANPVPLLGFDREAAAG